MYMYNHREVFKIGLVIVFSAVYIPDACASFRCPYKCKCGATSVTCVDQELIEVPDFKRIISEPITIDLSKNDIEEVTNISFNYKKLEILITLKLNDNLIFDVEVKAFSTLSKLQHLDLSNNLIEDFSGEIIASNKELKELKLAGNLFGSKTPELKSDTLEVLDLSFSKISQFSIENVEGLPNLRFLYLQANDLLELDYTIFGDHLQFIDLSFNPWKCQCDTIKLYDHLVKNNLTVIANPVQCYQSFRRYEDIYDYTGPIKITKWCEDKNRTQTNSVAHITPKPIFTDTKYPSNEKCIDYKIWIGISVTIVGALVAGICLVIVLRRQRRSKQNVRSKNTLYSELPTKNTVCLQKDFEEDIFTHGKGMV